jgi:hypothetical protein
VLAPLKLVIDNYPEGQEELCEAPNHPQKPDWGKRPVPFAKELWIEREDFMEVPSKGYFRLFPGNKVRLRYGFVIECTGCDKDADGNVTTVHCNYFPDSKSGTPGADNYKVKGNIHWVSAQHAYRCEVRLYDRLFANPAPGSGGRDSSDINPDAKKVITAYLEEAVRKRRPRNVSSSSATATSSPTGWIQAGRARVQPGGDTEGLWARATDMAGGWGCPTGVDDRCTKINDLPCDPGMKGCVLAGRFRFADDDTNQRLKEKKAREEAEKPADPTDTGNAW